MKIFHRRRRETGKGNAVRMSFMGSEEKKRRSFHDARSRPGAVLCSAIVRRCFGLESILRIRYQTVPVYPPP